MYVPVLTQLQGIWAWLQQIEAPSPLMQLILLMAFPSVLLFPLEGTTTWGKGPLFPTESRCMFYYATNIWNLNRSPKYRFEFVVDVLTQRFKHKHVCGIHREHPEWCILYQPHLQCVALNCLLHVWCYELFQTGSPPLHFHSLRCSVTSAFMHSYTLCSPGLVCSDLSD